jgi:hypothetical protein
VLAIGVDRWLPIIIVDTADAVTDTVIDRIPEAEFDVAVDAFLGQSV